MNGNTAIIPSNRNWDIKLRGFAKEIQVDVKVQGKETPCKTAYDLKSNTTSVIIENVSVNSEITIEISGENLITDNAGATDRLYDILLHSQIDYATKTRLWNAFEDKNSFLCTACPQKEYSKLLSAAEKMRNIIIL